MRQRHTKSRLGCRECKSRRVKCDELRPSCTKCSLAGRQCSFLGEHSVLPPPSLSNSHSTYPTLDTAPLVLGPLPSNGLGVVSSLSASDPSAEECYGSLHLRLLYHFEHDVADVMRANHPGIDFLIEVFLQEGFQTPYLMDEILGFSALHKSMHNKDTHHFYATEATRLQTRALSVYNSTKPELSEKTCLHMFLLSSLLSHHILADVHSYSHNGLGPALDALTRSIGVYRGLSTITRMSWSMFDERLQRRFSEGCLRESTAVSIDSQNECGSLLKRLEASDLGPSSIATYREAVEILQSLFDNYPGGSVLNAVQDWLIRVSSDYVTCLNQRRPEALVILAYFAALLHRAAHYWYMGDLGRRLLYLINDQLGPFWADWLEWPGQSVK